MSALRPSVHSSRGDVPCAVADYGLRHVLPVVGDDEDARIAGVSLKTSPHYQYAVDRHRHRGNVHVEAPHGAIWTPVWNEGALRVRYRATTVLDVDAHLHLSSTSIAPRNRHTCGWIRSRQL